MTRKDKRKLYLYREKQEYKQKKREIYRTYHVGELDTKVSEYDKKWTSILLKMSFAWVSCGFLAIFLSGLLGIPDQALIAITTITVTVVVEIIGVSLAYKYKSYKGKKAEEEVKLEREKMSLTGIIESVTETVTGREG